MDREKYFWGGERRFNSYSQFCKVNYGGRVQRLPIDAGFTCPNRKSRSDGGCTYCSNNAFSPAYTSDSLGVKEQLLRGKDFFRKRHPSPGGYFAYFQSYTNTFAPVGSLRNLCNTVLEDNDIVGIIIATRPDCLPEAVIDLLAELNERTRLCVEIGVETFNNGTLEHIKRGHTAECSFEAFDKLRRRNIATCAHIIFGLPGENPGMWMNDVNLVNQLAPDFIKFHQLQILKGTQMETEFRDSPTLFHTFTADEYVGFICDYLERLSPSVVIERFCAEVPLRYLAVSNWQLLRHDALVRKIENELALRGSFQGSQLLECQ